MGGESEFDFGYIGFVLCVVSGGGEWLIVGIR